MLVALGALPVLGYSCHSRVTPKWGTSVSTASWMPPGATDGAYFHYGDGFLLGSPVFFYEYDISESDFRRYLESISITPKEIESPQTIYRYLTPFIRYNDFDAPYFTVEGSRGTAVVDSEGYKRAVSTTVNEGIYFLERPPNDDCSRHYVYDRSRNRAFIEIHAR